MRRLGLYILLLLFAASQAKSLDIVKVVQWKASDGGNDHWYGLIIDHLYWEDALYTAGTIDPPSQSGLSGKGYLATILSAQENEFVKSNVLAPYAGGPFADQFWLGGFDYDGVWSWTTNEPMTYYNWSNREPNNQGKETSMSMWGSSVSASGQWNNSFKDDSWALHMTQKSVIEWGAVDSSTLVTPLPPPLCCVKQWKASDGGNNHWYALYTRDYFWEEATDAVFQMTVIPEVGTQRQPYLASISSQSENQFVLDSIVRKAPSDYTYDRYWLGLRHGQYHAVNGQGTPDWMWSSHEPYYWGQWASAQPGNLSTDFVASMTGRTGQGPAGSSPGNWASSWMNPTYMSILEWGNPYCGDVDSDKKINIVDVLFFFQWIQNKARYFETKNADATGDGTINIADAVQLVNFLFYRQGLLACSEW